MAEQEIIKHGKNIYKLWNNDTYGLWHKLKEFLIEIFIIVFAITLSIWFHNRSEHQHQQDDTKEFLIGLREDLKNDSTEMEEDRKSYLLQKAAFSYINNTRLGQSLDIDSLRGYVRWIFNTTGLHPNDGRFQGFKSSGKIGTIEDKELQNNIMDLYEEDIPSLITGTDGYVARKNKLFEFLADNNKRLTDSTSNFAEVLNAEKSHNICASLCVTEEITARYDKCLEKINIIVAAINKEYGEAKTKTSEKDNKN